MRLRQATSLWIAALMSATGALADVRGVRIPPTFTAEEIALIGRDPRLVGVTKRCAQQLRQALDALTEKSPGSRVGLAPEPCLTGSTGHGRASDEGALDILKILKDVSEQGTSRSGPGDVGGDRAGDRAARGSPSFTGEEIELIHKDKHGRLTYAARRCAWQLRHALDSMRYGPSAWPPQRPCLPQAAPRGSDEGALDILKILREASGEPNN
jgi:hypothetical protein